jgi:hypothetical protein
MHDKLLCLMISKLLLTNRKCIATGLLVILFTVSSTAQDSTLNKLLSIKKLASIESKAASYNSKIDKQTEKYLQKIERQEKKIIKKISKKDSLALKELLSYNNLDYDNLLSKVKNLASKSKQEVREYLPNMDSTTIVLRYLLNNKASFKNFFASANVVQTSLDQYQLLQQKLELVTLVKAQIRERRQILLQTLEKYNLTKYLKRYDKLAYYYIEQIKEYKNILKDPSKIEKLVLTGLKKIPAFNEFMQNNGLMSASTSVVSLPNLFGNNNSANLVGLQSRASVQQLIGQQFGSNSNTIQAIQQSFQNAQNQIATTQLNSDGSNDNLQIKDFKPNGQRLKSFKNRLELGVSMNSEKAQNIFLSNMANVGLSVGYKINDGIVIGTALSYRLGVKGRVDKLKLTNESIGLRAYFDAKFSKNNFWATIGYEQNYMIQFKNIPELNQYSNWEHVFLFGLSKKIKMKNKGLKIQLLYDFLALRKIPNTSPFIYRITFTK